MDKIRYYLRDVKIDLQESDARKIPLTIAINFTSPNDAEEERVLHSMSVNIKFAYYNDANESVFWVILIKISRSLKKKKKTMMGSDFIFDSVQVMHYKCHREHFTRGDSYIDFSDWLKKEKVAANPKNNDNKCFQFAVAVALKYEEIKWKLERIPKY